MLGVVGSCMGPGDMVRVGAKMGERGEDGAVVHVYVPHLGGRESAGVLVPGTTCGR
jgi:hypothetical protein